MKKTTALPLLLGGLLGGCASLPHAPHDTDERTRAADPWAPATPRQGLIDPAFLATLEHRPGLSEHLARAGLNGLAALLERDFHRIDRGVPRLLGRPPGTPRVGTTLLAEAAHPLANAPLGAALDEAVPQPPRDLWARIRAGFRLPDADRHHPRVQAHLNWYRRHPAYLERVARRARPYLYHIVEAVEARGMPSEIALLPIVESAFKPFAYSHGRAAGIWQFVPGTARLYGLKQNWWYDGRRDVYASTDAALRLLTNLHRRFDGDWLLALAAYNSGEGTVRRAIRKNKRRGRPTDFWHLDLPRETRGYVPKLLALARLVADPAKHGIALLPIANEPVLERVDPGSQLDLALAAELAGLSIEELYTYNPGYNRWATDPDGPHHLLLPIEHVPRFQAALAQLPPEDRIGWRRHKIRRGETLRQIARRYRTDVDLIRRVNGIRGHTIRAGDDLIIPVATRDAGAYTLSASQRLLRTQNIVRQGRHKVIHHVRRGETLWSIARRYKVGVRELARWNQMAPRDTLHPGQRLVVWTKQRTLALHRTGPARTQKIAYRVRRGESLALISRKFRVSIDDLVRWNRLDPKDYLQPGQRLTVYVDVTEQSNI